MVGFTAEHPDGEIAIDDEELIDAQWFRADALPPHPAKTLDHPRFLIDDYVERFA